MCADTHTHTHMNRNTLYRYESRPTSDGPDSEENLSLSPDTLLREDPEEEGQGLLFYAESMASYVFLKNLHHLMCRAP